MLLIYRAFCPIVHMETKRTRRSFSPEFKKQAAQRVLLLKEPVANVAAELEIKPETLSKWIKDYEKMVAEDPNFAAPSAPEAKRPVLKMTRKKLAPESEALTPTLTETAQEAEPVEESVPSSPVFEQIETKTEEPSVNKNSLSSVHEPSVETSVVPEETIVHTQEKTSSDTAEEANPKIQSGERGYGLRRQGKQFRNQRPNRNDKNISRQQNLDYAQSAAAEGEFVEEQQTPIEPPPPKRPVPKASEGRSWKVAHALDQRPNYREENEEFGYVDEFSVPAEDLDQVWQILNIMQEKADVRAFGEMVHQKGLNVPDEVLENPRAATMQGPNVPNKPWLRKMRMHPAAEEFFQTTPDYSKAVYESYEGLDIRLDKNSEGTPILSVEKKPMGAREITIDFSKFDRFVDDFYGDFVRDCKKVMMELNPKEYPGLNAFIRIPDEPMWNPKLWAGIRTFTWNEGESLSQAWIRYANSLRRNSRNHH